MYLTQLEEEALQFNATDWLVELVESEKRIREKRKNLERIEELQIGIEDAIQEIIEIGINETDYEIY